MPPPPPSRPAWTFTGCGLLGGYYLGVWHALSRPTVPRALFDAQTSRFHGASAGALISAAIASGCHHADTTSAFERIAEAVRSTHGGLLRCDLLALVRAEADALLPEDAHEVIGGRVTVLATDAGSAPFLSLATFDSFDSRAMLLDAVLVSSYVPGIMSRPRLTTPLSERTMLDGGIWSFEAGDGERLVSVSPFGGAFDVSPTSQADGRLRWPRMRVGMGWLDVSPSNLANAYYAFHPVQQLESLYRTGYDDAERFLRRECPGIVLAPYHRFDT